MARAHARFMYRSGLGLGAMLGMLHAPVWSYAVAGVGSLVIAIVYAMRDGYLIQRAETGQEEG